MKGEPLSVRDELSRLGESIREDFVQNRRVMSFAEYLDLVATRPAQQLRSAAHYLRDCFDHFGTRQIDYPWGPARRFVLFDCPWADGRDRLVGQEEVQNRVYRVLSNFVHEGVSNKLVLLHGPNGSAKSTFVRTLGRALQHYSSLDEGALYRFNWIFPAAKLSRGGIGFSGDALGGTGDASDTFAYLPDELVDAKLRDELRDHPLLLVPGPRRGELMRRMLDATGDASFPLADYLQHGQLSHKNRQIFEALLASYQGDYVKVLRHVQVERFFIVHRYREGYATVEPQMSVDAHERQITADRTTAQLPPALQSLALFEAQGELVDANRGMIEYSDLLKRPLEAYKYLLATVERASVSLNNATLFLDLCYIGSSNEIHLQAFKEVPEFQSFRGRLELIRVPYLLDVLQEEQIYREKLREAAATRHIAPHCAYVAALWAVLTRMRKPMADKFPKKLSDLATRLTPLEKAELYAYGKAPESLSAAQGKDLLASLKLLVKESETYPNYEGRTGASPREIQVVIFNAANSSAYAYVSPVAILDEIEELSKQTSVYEFLKQEPLPGGFHDNRRFIDVARDRLLDRIDDEVRSSLGLVEELEFDRIFGRYVSHVMNAIKQEKVRNPTTGKEEKRDETMMRDVEKILDVGAKANEFRQDLIAKVGAWSLDHSGQKPDFAVIFPDYFKRLREATFEERKKAVRGGVADLLKLVTGNAGLLSADATKRARASLDALINRFGYIEASARDAVALLVRARYS
jgi:serine protein kinase